MARPATAAALVLALSAPRCGPLLDPTGPSAANEAPEIRTVTVSPDVVPVGGSATVVVDASDPDGERIFYRFFASAGTVSVPDPAAPGRATYVHAGGASASDLIVVTVTDSRNASTSASAEVHLRVNSAPSVTLRSTGSCHPHCTVTFAADAFDAEDDPLTYSWRGCASGSGPSATCEIVAPAKVSAAVIVSDGRGGVTTAFADAVGLNEAPIVEGGGRVKGVPALLQVRRTDPDGDDTTCGWTGDCQCTGSDSSFNLVCDMPPGAGACTMVFRCVDSFGASADTAFDLTR